MSVAATVGTAMLVIEAAMKFHQVALRAQSILVRARAENREVTQAELDELASESESSAQELLDTQ